MINFIFLLVIISAGFLIKHFGVETPLANTATYALGIIMLAGFAAGKLVKKIKSPSVTGYILMGILIGPFVLQLITRQHVQDLQLLNGLALSIIALTAGGEIKISGLKENLRSILYILIFQTLVIIVGIFLLVLALKNFIPFFSNTAFFPDLNALIAAGLLIGIISTASSPSTILAVIVESKKKNRYTDLILSIVMLKDIVILFLFVIGLSFSRSLVVGSEFGASGIMKIFLELTGSLVSGIAIGAIIVLYLRYIKKETIVFILALSFFSYEIFEPLHLHPLLIMMIAGFIVENFSTEGDQLIENLEAISPPVYIIFFTLTGASINISHLKSLWLLTLIIVAARMGLKYLGTYTGAKLIGENPLVKHKLWMSFISQAGLSLGMATIISANFSGFGENISALIVSVIIINQIAGPLILKYMLDET